MLKVVTDRAVCMQSFGQRLYNFANHWKFHVQDFIHVRPVVQGAL